MRKEATKSWICGKVLCAMPETMEISDAAKSGDGSTQNVGIKVDAKFQCAECRQKFDSEKAKQLHWKFIHDPNRHQEETACCFCLFVWKGRVWT
ncbi:unnamed protein product [Effrenium voratum]|nr:unnamed protein product [Effrenium voratum]